MSPYDGGGHRDKEYKPPNRECRRARSHPRERPIPREPLSLDGTNRRLSVESMSSFGKGNRISGRGTDGGARRAAGLFGTFVAPTAHATRPGDPVTTAVDGSWTMALAAGTYPHQSARGRGTAGPCRADYLHDIGRGCASGSASSFAPS